MEIDTEIIIGIPGKWLTRHDIVTDIATKSNGLLFAGFVLMDTTTNEGYKLEVHDYDPDLANAFEIAGRPRISKIDVQAIQLHTFTLYLVAKGGSLEYAQKVLNIGCGLLQAGGLAIKVETTGKAHTAKDWLAFAATNNETALYHAFVTLIGSAGKYYSCGMHNLGYRDAIIQDNISSDEAAQLLQNFLLYTLIEKPTLGDGHTFSETENSQYYRLHGVPCNTYPSDHTFHNPFGMWQFEAV
jgi:hypothetical protein